MGILKDVIDVINTSVDTDELKSNLTNKKYSSIATRASEGTLQFPILISDAMDIETAQMIVKALERNYATFVQTVLSMNSVTKDADISKYLRQFHQNYNPGGDAFNTANIVRVFEEGYQYTKHENGNVVAMETYNNTATAALVNSNREQSVNLLEDLRTDILNRKFNPTDTGIVYGFKDPLVRRKHNVGAVTEAGGYVPPHDSEITAAFRRTYGFQTNPNAQDYIDDAGIMQNHNYRRFERDFQTTHRRTYERELTQDLRAKQTFKQNTAMHDARIMQIDAQIKDAEARLKFAKNQDDRQQAQLDLQKARDERDKVMHDAQLAKNATSMTKDIADTNRINRDLNTFDIPNQMLKDNDVKKANELIATTMHARVHMVNSDGTPIGAQDFVLGIKGTMHPIKSEEMINNMLGACKNNNRVFNFLRWTTGEISFFKDFWLNVPDMKRDIANESRGASRWWIALKNRRALGKISVSALVKDKILPNATIVISAEEVELIKSHYGYDLMNPYFMKKIMDTYYLLGFTVVDSSAQVAHFYFDGNTDFESVSFSGLEKENTRDERKFKEMLKVINRN